MSIEQKKSVLDWVKKARQKKRYQAEGKQIINFLHIGKTGGSAIKFALKDWAEKPLKNNSVIYLHSHRVGLKDIPKGEKVFFFLRDPISRFKSGFYSRKRQGQPRIYSPWSEDEKITFERFETPNDLAMALSSPNLEMRKNAEFAIGSIKHTRLFTQEFFSTKEYFSSRLSDIFFIGFQETLSTDFEILKAKLSLPEDVALPNDDIKAHRNPNNLNTKISPEAIENLMNWYKTDLELIQFCHDMIQENPHIRQK